MAQRCTVCDHPERAAIDRALVDGVPGAAALGERYGLARSSVKRHAARHVPAAVAAASEAATVARGDALLARVEALTVETHRILRTAKREKDHELALRAIARLEKQTELLARLLGELRDGPTVNLFVGGEFQAVVNVLLGVLAPHPALRAEVGTALARLAGRRGRRRPGGRPCRVGRSAPQQAPARPRRTPPARSLPAWRSPSTRCASPCAPASRPTRGRPT
jgi:hypothetical protein